MSQQHNGGGSANGKLLPNLDQNSTKVLNLTVLQRLDPSVEEILITASHVTLYEFNIDLNQWSRKDVEGSLFVVKRNTQPRFQFVVMNRRNTDNLVEDLLGDFEYEVQVPYLLYRNAAQEVNGIWFYNSPECEAIANLFSRILSAFSKAKVTPKTKTSTVKSEFEELEAIPSLDMIEGLLEPPTSSATTNSDVPDDSFINFFSAALSAGSVSISGIPAQAHQPTIPGPPPSLVQATIPTALPALQTSVPLSISSSRKPPLDIMESSSSVVHAANLLKPSFFAPLSSSSPLTIPPVVPSSMPSAPPLQPSVALQRPYGTPLLQPFPPPNPSPSLTPATAYSPVITRDRVRDALLRLAQNNQFIDMVYREILDAHYS